MGRRKILKVDLALRWIRKQPRKLKILVTALGLVSSLVAMNLLLEDHWILFLLGEAFQVFGIVILIYKILGSKSCAGLSLKTQELTALCLFMRIPGNYVMLLLEHTLLDMLAIIFTSWMIYIIRRKFKSTYAKDLDKFPMLYTVVAAVVLTALIHPDSDFGIVGYMWAFSMYIKTVAVLPQLNLMHNEKMVQPITAHYVFAMGVGRFLSFAYWVIMVYKSGGKFLFLGGYGSIWLLMALLSEIVHTFILADFCYYYLKFAMYDQLVGELTATR